MGGFREENGYIPISGTLINEKRAKIEG